MGRGVLEWVGEDVVGARGLRGRVVGVRRRSDGVSLKVEEGRVHSRPSSQPRLPYEQNETQGSIY